MPRKQDPAETIVDYFENAPIDAAKTMFTVARAILRKRAPQTIAKKKAKGSAAARPLPAPATMGD